MTHWPCSGGPGAYPLGEALSLTWMLGRGRVHLAVGVAVAVTIVGSAMAKATCSDLGNDVIVARTTSWELFVSDGDLHEMEDVLA